MERTRAWGIEPGYTDYKGEWRDTPAETQRSLLDAMEADADSPPDAPVVVLRRGQRLDRDGTFEVALEDGTQARVRGGEPIELPYGYHQLVDGRENLDLIVSPGTCYLPADLHTWGWAVQLYSVHSATSWGIGDLGDLARLGTWAREKGAGMLLINPLHAAAPEQTSPYYPSSRSFRNPLYIDVERVAADMGVDIDPAPGRALNEEPIVEREAINEVKMAVLQRLWKRWKGSADFDDYRARNGDSLTRFASHVADGDEDQIEFHIWLQWLLRRQLAGAEAEIDIVHDLAIGIDPVGADAHIWKDVFAHDVRIGAPPDEFSLGGQDWSMPPFDPWKLRARRYEPFIQTIRAALSSGAGVRIDHVMGLFRLWWIPPDAEASEGAYVRYPKDDLLNIIALESQRAESYVIGEDLGTVEPEVREEMLERNMMSYRLLYFEPSPPADFPECALACVTNHDLPTIAGLWTGTDLAELKELGLEADDEAEAVLRARLQERAGVDADAALEVVIERTYAALAAAPSRIKVATLEDAFAVERKPNQPGTTDERPNWSLKLPLSIEEFDSTPLPNRISKQLKKRPKAN